jgi:hypothetical protein
MRIATLPSLLEYSVLNPSTALIQVASEGFGEALQALKTTAATSTVTMGRILPCAASI